MKMTKAKAIKIAKKYFDLNVRESPVHTICGIQYYLTQAPFLCYNIPNRELQKAWYNYWDTINNKNWATMTEYFKHDYSIDEATLLRLLVLHQFINEHYI
jgi:hypothetical protein